MICWPSWALISLAREVGQRLSRLSVPLDRQPCFAYRTGLSQHRDLRASRPILARRLTEPGPVIPFLANLWSGAPDFLRRARA